MAHDWGQEKFQLVLFFIFFFSFNKYFPAHFLAFWIRWPPRTTCPSYCHTVFSNWIIWCTHEAKRLVCLVHWQVMDRVSMNWGRRWIGRWVMAAMQICPFKDCCCNRPSGLCWASGLWRLFCFGLRTAFEWSRSTDLYQWPSVAWLVHFSLRKMSGFMPDI